MKYFKLVTQCIALISQFASVEMSTGQQRQKDDSDNSFERYLTECQDDKGKIYNTKNNKILTCNRIKNLKRQHKWCRTKKNIFSTKTKSNALIADLCPKTCWQCAPPIDVCEDDETFSLGRKTKNCLFFRTENRRKTCKRQYIGFKVEDRCCKSCKLISTLTCPYRSDEDAKLLKEDRERIAGYVPYTDVKKAVMCRRGTSRI